MNRNKRSLTLDLREPADHTRAVELVRRADVLFENFRPGTMARHGLGYERAHALNPGLVYCSVSGFGPGPGAALPGYDLLVQAVGGLMSVTGPGPGEPVKTGVALVDVLTGLHAAVGVLAALRERETTGEGQHVEVNLLTSLLSSMVNQAAGYTLAGAVPGILGNRHPSIAPYEVFEAADRQLVVAVGNDRQFAALCEGLAAPELARDQRFATNTGRVAHVAELAEALSALLAGRTAAEWFELLTPLGVPCGPVNDLAGCLRPGRVAGPVAARHGGRGPGPAGPGGQSDRSLPHSAPLRPAATAPGRAHRGAHRLAGLLTIAPPAPCPRPSGRRSVSGSRNRGSPRPTPDGPRRWRPGAPATSRRAPGPGGSGCAPSASARTRPGAERSGGRSG